MNWTFFSQELKANLTFFLNFRNGFVYSTLKVLSQLLFSKAAEQ
jgi:hypothetical protein